jgi:hypothetical protein
MPSKAGIDRFVDAAAGLELSDSFNPYKDLCPEHDLASGPEIRRENLRSVLTAVGTAPVDELWLGLEPTWRGGRRTGLAMTDEPHLRIHAARWGASRVRCATDTKGPPERTAGYVWASLNALAERIFLWNAVPVHTHLPGKPYADRRHTDAEREACLPLLASLLELIRPSLCVAVGVDAEKAFEALDRTSTRVRHPSNAGHIKFAEAIRELHR